MNQPPVLLYHRITERPLLAGTWVTPAQLAAHLDRLIEAGYRALSASEWLQASYPPAQTSFLLTFDDATEDLYRYRRILQARKIPAVIFAPISLLGAENQWEWPLPTRRARHLRPEQLCDLLKLPGGWEVGLHGATHRDLTRLPAAELRREMHQGRARLSELVGSEVRLISYPYGRVDRRVVACASRAGFAGGFVVARTPPGIAPALAVQRRPVYCIDGPENVLVKVTDPHGRTWRGRWELSKERVAHATGRWSARHR